MMVSNIVMICLFSSVLSGVLCNQNFVAFMMPVVGKLVYRSLMSSVISFMHLLVRNFVISCAISKEFFILLVFGNISMFFSLYWEIWLFYGMGHMCYLPPV